MEEVARLVAATVVLIVSIVVLGRIAFRLSESKHLKVVSLLVLLGVPPVIGVWAGLERGWDSEDTVRITVGFLVLALGGITLYRKQQRKTKNDSKV